MTMWATYSPEDNKLRLYATSRLDKDTYDRVKAEGFKWAPRQDLFVALMWTPAREDVLIELCGEIGDEDTSLVERQEQRAERFDGYSGHRRSDAEAAQKAVAAIADHIPLGQPILVGHHSERHARKDAERIENGMRKAVKMWDTAQYWQERAKGAIRHAKYKERPDVRARRIKTIEAEQRKQQREVDRLSKLLTFWQQEGIGWSAARTVCNYLDRGCVRIANGEQHWSAWSALTDGQVTVEEVRAQRLASLPGLIHHYARWVAHCASRLVYEHAMLEEQGATDLLKPKPKSAKAQLPLCNYRALDGLDIENIYNRGETIHYPQVEMTQAEYARIHADYKGTRAVDHSHRVRTTMRHHALVCVFLTDTKVHERPAPQDPPAPPIPLVADRPPAREKLEDELTGAAAIDAMRAALKTGVQVVSAPQLFPTPDHVARQLVELADIAPGMRVLEPSAGTGALIDAISLRDGVDIEAVEINCQLADRLYQRLWKPVKIADFLKLTPKNLGLFDRIVMNPPFDHGSDITHIEHAQRFLKPGGRLVAICANGPRQQEAFAEATDYIELPEGTFKEQGTNVRTAIVVIDAEVRDVGFEAFCAEESEL